MKKIITKGIMELGMYRQMCKSLLKLYEGDNKARARARRVERTAKTYYFCFESGFVTLPFFFA